MRRRTLLQSLVATLAAQTGALASSGGSGLKEFERRKSEITAKAIAAFPFQRLEVRGEDALATWEKLTIAGRGCPIVIGDDIALVTMMGPFDVSSPPPRKSVEEVLAAAKRISVPDDLFARRKKEDAETLEATKKMVAEPDESLPTIVTKTDPKTGVGITTEYWYVGPSALSPSADPESHVLTPDETRAWMLRHPPEPPVGEWPDKPAQSVGLSVATDIVSGKWHPKVHIAIIPTDDWTTIPAHLRWGGWNDCPAPEYHVAALRSWRDRYGVELIGLGADTMNMRAARRPKSRDEAIALAREQYAYCTDIVEQGTETFSNLAASLVADDWWFFWWD